MKQAPELNFCDQYTYRQSKNNAADSPPQLTLLQVHPIFKGNIQAPIKNKKIPSLTSLAVSVDVKTHVYLQLHQWTPYLHLPLHTQQHNHLLCSHNIVILTTDSVTNDRVWYSDSLTLTGENKLQHLPLHTQQHDHSLCGNRWFWTIVRNCKISNSVAVKCNAHCECLADTVID